jgi:hypothetical protein
MPALGRWIFARTAPGRPLRDAPDPTELREIDTAGPTDRPLPARSAASRWAARRPHTAGRRKPAASQLMASVHIHTSVDRSAPCCVAISVAPAPAALPNPKACAYVAGGAPCDGAARASSVMCRSRATADASFFERPRADDLRGNVGDRTPHYVPHVATGDWVRLLVPA